MPVLMGGSPAVTLGRNDRFDPAADQQGTGGIAVIGPVGDQPIRPLPWPPPLAWPTDRNGVEGGFEESDLRRGCRAQVCSQRSTRAIDQYHPRCSLAALGRPNFGAPFFASAKHPESIHSSGVSVGH